MRMVSHIALGGGFALSLAALGCSNFDTSRHPAPRGTFGRELFAVICDRVGAQALRDDVAGLSFRPVCHADPVTGAYADKVDQAILPPLYEGAQTPEGQIVSLAQQQANRAHRIARIEALGRRREELVGALDSAVPNIRIAIATPPSDGKACDPPAAGAADLGFESELAATLSRMVDLYDDPDQTIPSVTRALGRSLDDVKADIAAQAALARFDARQGYRPMPIALGSVRPIMAYPHIVDLARSLFGLLLTEPGQEQDASRAFTEAMSVAYEELRTPDADAPSQPIQLGQVDDPMLPGRSILTRPRSLLEGLDGVLSTTGKAFTIGPADYIVRRDVRGYAAMPKPNFVPAPFVDMTGPLGVPDGLPDVDDLGQFITNNGILPVSPFFAPPSISGGAQDGVRDPATGRAIASAESTDPNSPFVYDYVDMRQTFLAAMTRAVVPFFASSAGDDAAPKEKETAMNALGALPVLAGTRDLMPVATKVYPPDPRAVSDWTLGHTTTPPIGLGTLPVNHAYRAFHSEDSPIADLVYALGQVLSAQEMDELFALAQVLFTDHQQELASLVGMALEVRATAAKHPEAIIPATSTFWDDVFVQLARVTSEPGLMEDILRGFADPGTLPLEQVLSAFFAMKDDISYDMASLNGPSIDLDTGVHPPSPLTVPVDRSQPDMNANRSEMQKFLQLLHDTNGLSICTKDGAIVHIRAVLPNTTIPINFDYPTDPVYTPLVCGIVGATPPTHLNKCAVFGYTNVMSLLLDVLLDKAQLTVQDPCLNKLMSSSIAQLAGGADHFLEEISGVDGFSLHPNLRGFARLLYFKTPYPGLPTDTNPANALTLNFLRDTIDPIPSKVCDLDPFTTPDGTVYPLRHCSTVNDVLRARDADALFPVDEFGFVKSLQPLAKAFDKHNKPLLFADLFDVLHIHWGSSRQTPDVCDPTLPRTDSRWCAQSGLVTFEPLYSEILGKGVFARLQSFIAMLATIQVPHCDAYDPSTKLCTSVTHHDGVHVVAEALTLLLNPARTPGLVDRQGNALALRSDGTRSDPVTGMALMTNAFASIDRAFTAYASAHPGDQARQTMWHAARSEFADAFLGVDGSGATAAFRDPSLVSIVPKIISLLRDQIATQCSPGSACAWAQHDVPQKVDDAIEGPTFAALADLADAVRRDDNARTEVERLVRYLLDAASGNEAQAGVLSAMLDALQVLEDDANLTPFKRILAGAVAAPVTDEKGAVIQRSLADASLRSLNRIFARDVQGTGASACIHERDPNGVIRALLKNLVTPMGDEKPSPIEVIMSVIGDVNRASPEKTTKFDSADYGNIANEMSELCLDSSRGLEQFYAVIREAIRP